MGEQTGISWTDHTFNSWWGCTKIAPGCDNCYADAFDKRTGGDYWNPHMRSRRTSDANWRKIYKWNEQAKHEGRSRKVFCGSMMDWCDNAIPDSWRDDLFRLIKETPFLDWQLLTKRATRIARCLPTDWTNGYHNVWLGVTCENKEYGYPRIDCLRQMPAAVRFVSADPLLEGDMDDIYLDGIDWLIIGGESGPGFRKMEEMWATDLLDSCDEQGVAVWFKQHGGNTKDKGGCELEGIEYKQWPTVGKELGTV